MYRCTDSEEFLPQKRHSEPPRFCGFCGARMRGAGNYCSERCLAAGEAYRRRDRENQAAFEASAVVQAVREVDRYNKEKGTKLSYGQYFALKGEGKL